MRSSDWSSDVCSSDLNVVVEASGSQWMGCRATHGVTGGKYCFEVLIRSDGIARVGFSSLSATRELGKDMNGFGFGGTAKKSHAGKCEDYGMSYGAGEEMGRESGRERGRVDVET